MDKFADWLNTEIQSRGWSFRETGRRSSLSGTTIGDVIAKKTRPGYEFCLGIARAFKMRPETILRQAGLLPPIPQEKEELDELIYYYGQLTIHDQNRARVLIQALAERRIEYDEATIDEPD